MIGFFQRVKRVVHQVLAELDTPVVSTGAITAPTVTVTGLTTGRVVMTSTGGLLVDDTTIQSAISTLQAGLMVPVTESGASRSLTDADNGAIILCTAAGGCAITVPNTLSVGFNCMFVQKGAAAVTFTGSSVTLHLPVANTAATSALDTTVSVIKYASGHAQLAGSLA